MRTHKKDILERFNEAVPVESLRTQVSDKSMHTQASDKSLRTHVNSDSGFPEPVAKVKKLRKRAYAGNRSILNSTTKSIEAREAIASLYRSVKVAGA